MAEGEPPVSRTASCACRSLQVELSGDPQMVSACNCTECQRRTGSVFGVGAYFYRSQVLSTTGDARTFDRKSDASRSLSMHFCPDCGTTVHWDLEMLPEMIGVAVGCFADPAFPAPDRAVWCHSMSEWVTFPASVRTFPNGAS